jgi:superinfection exclusion protein B
VDPSKLMEWVKLSPRYLIPIGVLLGVLLTPLVNGLRLAPFVAQFGPYIGVAFLLDWLLVLSALLAPFIPTSDQLRAKLEKRAKLRAGQRRLHELTPEEKAILRPYLQQNTNTQFLGWQRGDVMELVEEGIITFTQTATLREGLGTPFNMRPWAKRYLSEHPELVDLPALPAAPEE